MEIYFIKPWAVYTFSSIQTEELRITKKMKRKEKKTFNQYIFCIWITDYHHHHRHLLLYFFYLFSFLKNKMELNKKFNSIVHTHTHSFSYGFVDHKRKKRCDVSCCCNYLWHSKKKKKTSSFSLRLLPLNANKPFFIFGNLQLAYRKRNVLFVTMIRPHYDKII